MPPTIPRACAPLVALVLCLSPARPLTAQSETYELEASEGDRRWTQAEPDPTRDPRIDEARRLLAEDRPGRAKRVLDAWIAERDGQRDPYFPEALLLRGDAKAAMGNEYDALFDYERLLWEFPQSEQFLTAVEREMDIAERYLGGLKRKILGMRLANTYEIAIELLIRVQERVPGSDLAETAAIRLADHYFDRREMALARDAYDLYILNHPTGPNRAKAEERLIYAEVARFKGPRYDSGGLLDARVRTRNFAQRYPERAERTGINEGLVARIDESLAAQMLEMSRWYESQGEDRAQRYVLARLVREHPRTSAAAKALETLERRGWMEELELQIAPDEGEGVLFEGPAAGQVEQIGEPEAVSEPPGFDETDGPTDDGEDGDPESPR